MMISSLNHVVRRALHTEKVLLKLMNKKECLLPPISLVSFYGSDIGDTMSTMKLFHLPLPIVMDNHAAQFKHFFSQCGYTE